MANAYGVTIPSVKKQIIALAVLPAIALLGVYIPQFVQGNNELQVRKAAAAEQLAIAQDALEPVCERVAADDPYESYHDYGYRIIGYLRDNDLGAQAVYVYLSFDADGMLTDVDYTSQIDPEASLQTTSPAPSRISRRSAPRSTVGHFRCHTGPPHAMQPVG